MQHDISPHVQDGHHCTDATQLKMTRSWAAFYSRARSDSAASLSLVDRQQDPQSALLPGPRLFRVQYQDRAKALGNQLQALSWTGS
jgi:hypothetical protein